MKAEIEALFLRVFAALNGLRVNDPMHDEGKAALGGIRAHIDELTGALAAGDERLVAAAERAGVVYVGCDIPDALVERVEEQGAEIERLTAWFRLMEDAPGEAKETIRERALSAKYIGPIVASWQQDNERLTADLAAIRSTLSAALGVGGTAEELAAKTVKEISVLRERREDLYEAGVKLANIQEALSDALGTHGSAEELAKLAGKVIPGLAKRMSFERTETIDSRIKAAVEAAKGE